MKTLIIPAFALLSCAGLAAQTSLPLKEDLSLTEKNLKRLFSIKPDICCPAPPPEWSTCFATDSGYYKADTVRLYSGMNYYLTKNNCCYDVSWTFANSTTFNLAATHVCTEPPVSTIYPDNYGLKIKFSTVDNVLTMSVYKDTILKDRFALVQLSVVVLSNGQEAYELVMHRKKIK